MAEADLGCFRAVLLAEDNPKDALAIREAFEALGTGTLLRDVCDGAEAMRYIKGEGQFGDRAAFPFPNLILLDLEMPRVNGLEFLAWVRQTFSSKQLPVVVLTTSAFVSDVRTAYLLGANTFLTKPVGQRDLAETMRHIAQFWLRPEHPAEPDSEAQRRAA